MVMAALAQGLPVLLIPKQIRVAAMRLDMIHDGCRDEPSFFLAADAPGMTFQEKLPGLLPFPAVATCLCISPVALSLPFMFLTIFSSIRHQPGAARIFQDVFGLLGILPHLRHQKRTAGISPRSFILFLVTISYHTVCTTSCVTARPRTQRGSTA